MSLIKIATQILCAERIQSINRNANINGELGIEVILFNTPDSFIYTRDFAQAAYDALDGILPSPAPPPIPTNLSVAVTNNGVPVSYSNLSLSLDGVGVTDIIKINGLDVHTNEIEWVDLESRLSTGATGIQYRVSSDPPGAIREISSPAAEIAYDVFMSLFEEEAVGAAQ